LGGDSIKAVQITARLFDKNISVNVKDILTYQTIEQLYLHAEITDGISNYEQAIIEGEIGLNPIQSWFFEQNFKNPNFYNQSVLLDFKKTIDKEILQKTFKTLINHHDGLRLNYNPKKNVMFYNNSHLENEFVIEEHIINKSNNNLASYVQDLYHQIKNSFNITNTLLIKAAIIKESNSNSLFITAHHLLIDGVSWRLLLEDFQKIYNSLKKEQQIKLPKKTASLKDWYNKLQSYSQDNKLNEEINHWEKSNNSKFQISPDYLIDKWMVKDLEKTFIKLNEDQTDFLLKDANKIYNTNVEILLVAALVKTLKEWTSLKEIIIEMENHGRHLDDIDTSRTTGWFTSLFPVSFSMDNDSIGENIKHVKEQIRKTPNNGIGYGSLKYINELLPREKSLSELRFNYLGQFDGELNNDLFSYNNKYSSAEIDGHNQSSAKLEINAMIIEKRLSIEINYNQLAFNSNSIIRLTEKFESNLKAALEQIRNEDDVHFTVSDFDSVLEQEDLDTLFN
ncbi:MAG: non-ribosomal peptide synthetase, partial [bacterium]|nr:non-ribosomal peptide synthetase [bacterium]